MTDEYEDIDTFSDGDLAAPENLPTGVRYIGEVGEVKTDRAEPGNWVKFKEANQNGDTSAPAIDLVVNTRALANGAALPEDKNYYRQNTVSYFVGKNDKDGRNSLARLIKKATGMSDEELRAKGLKTSARDLKGAMLTYEVKLKEGDEKTFQKFVKIRVATPEEVAMVS